jgi:predicted Fe-S protein YdhL (DUF1289 family)
MQQQTAKSPCIGICKYNQDNLCVGCKRSSAEISSWINYSNTMKQAVLEDLKNRTLKNP